MRCDRRLAALVGGALASACAERATEHPGAPDTVGPEASVVEPARDAGAQPDVSPGPDVGPPRGGRDGSIDELRDASASEKTRDAADARLTDGAVSNDCALPRTISTLAKPFFTDGTQYTDSATLVVDSDYVWYSGYDVLYDSPRAFTGEQGLLQRAPRCGGSFEIVRPDSPIPIGGFVGAGPYLYWRNGHGITRFTKATEQEDDIVLDIDYTCRLEIVARGADLYFADECKGLIERVVAGSLVPEVIVSGADILTGDIYDDAYAHHGIAVTASDVYWIGNTGIQRAPIETGTASTFWAGLNDPSSIVIAGETFFVADVRSQLRSRSLDGGPARLVEDRYRSGLVADGTRVFWVSDYPEKPALLTLDVGEGGAPQALFSLYIDPRALPAVFGDRVYWLPWEWALSWDLSFEGVQSAIEDPRSLKSLDAGAKRPDAG